MSFRITRRGLLIAAGCSVAFLAITAPANPAHAEMNHGSQRRHHNTNHQPVKPCPKPPVPSTTTSTIPVPVTTSTTIPAATTTTVPATTSTTVPVMPPGKKAPLPPTPVKAPEHPTKVIGATTPTTVKPFVEIGTATSVSRDLPMTGNGAAAEALVGGTLVLAGLGLVAEHALNRGRVRR